MLRRVWVLLAIASLTVGCAGKGGFDSLSFQSANLDAPSFDLVPESGGKDTLFAADSGALGKKYNVTWDWGDGTYSYGALAEHRYGFTNGVMTVTMIATDDSGKQGIATRTIKLGNGENKVPTLTARAQKTWIEVGQPTNLTATGRDGDGDPLAYTWSWREADGAAETALATKEARTPISFDAPGKYAVKVRVRDPKGGEAVANLTIDVSLDIPSNRFEQTFNGTIIGGSGGQGASEKLWGTPAPDTGVDSVRHRYTLLYPGTTFIFLTWNDTTAAPPAPAPPSPAGGVQDLDLELRAANGTTIFRSEVHGPPTIPFEFNVTQQEPGDYDVIVRGYVAANLDYTVLVQSTLQITPERVAAVQG